jgi:SAM-dependent methyltransferase
MKIVGPTIVEPWRKLIEEAPTLKRLRDLWQRMHEYTVLDPACGSGNFLYLAYRELKRLEARLFERMAEISGSYDASQLVFGFVSARQFYGIDINPFAVELAKVTMMIARKLAIDELHITERALPLDNLDENFRAGDALIDELGNPARWPRVDVIIGNPPFLGSRYLAKERSYEYARGVQALFPEVPKMADYCVHWFRKAHDNLRPCMTDDPVAGRAGLVGTQNVRNGDSRVGGLDHIVGDGTIIEAVDNQPWSGEANVHVSIVNWVKTQEPALLPDRRKLWFKVKPSPAAHLIRSSRGSRADKDYELDFREAVVISASLSDEVDTTGARVLGINSQPKACFVGQYPFNEGFLLDPTEAKEWIAESPRNAEVVFPYMIGRDLVQDGRPSRWIIDFGRRDLIEASSYEKPFQRVRSLVMPTVLAKAEAERKATGKDSTRWTRLAERWWQFRDYQPGTMKSISRLSRYITCSRVTKRPIFAFASNEVHPDNTLMVFTFADDYSFGILQSGIHWQWFAAKCSKLTERLRYTAESVFDTLPWPQSPIPSQVESVSDAGRRVRQAREEALPKVKGGLQALYRTLELPGKTPLKEAQTALDAAVLKAYGFSPKKDLLTQLLALNLEVSRREQAGELVTAPGIPPGYPDPARIVTEDCIRAD